jgi:hypothetical protein
MDAIVIVGGVFVLCGIALNVAFQIGGRHLIRYGLDVHSFDVSIGSIRVLVIPCEDIGGVQALSTMRSLTVFPALHMLNRFVGRRVVIHSKNRFDIVVTPDNADMLLGEIRSIMAGRRELSEIKATAAT